MRSIQFIGPVALLCFGFSFGCGGLGNDEDSTQTPAERGSDTFAAPMKAEGRSSDKDAQQFGQAPADRGANQAPSDAQAGDAASEPASAKADPGPAPTSACTVEKDADGFFWRSSPKSDYVAYVPASYSPSTPMRAVVGLHGCGDNAMNFATWAVNPWVGRSKQTHIGISVSGETGSGKCWSKGGDDDKVLAAVDDLAKCFWIDRSKVIIAGFSSGGELAYRVGLMHASSFAGILIENSSISSAGSTPTELLAGATWKINIAHRAHSSDTVFPLKDVKADWSTIDDAGFPLETSEVSGDHNGTGDDWSNWLLPQSVSWVRPGAL